MGRGDGSDQLQLDDSRTTVRARLLWLDEQLLYHKDKYYNGQPEISDAEFDALEQEFVQLKEQYPELSKDLHSEVIVGAAVKGADFPEVRHEHQMLSLDKVHTDADLDKFLAKFPDQKFALWPKFDGVSLSLLYKNGQLERAATRGDGTVGKLITENARRINGVRQTLDQKIDCEIRGEVIMKRSDWKSYNAANPDKQLANPRNAVSGSMMQKDPAEVAKRKMTFFAYDLIIDDGDVAGNTVAEQLRQIGFDVQRYQEESDPDKIKEYIQQTEQVRPDLDYEIDGAVIRLADRDAFERAGYTSHHPRAAMAYKLAAEIGETTLLAVEWQVGKSGIVAPVGQISPLFLAGTTIRKASLHNIAQIEEKRINLNQRINIKRAGDVIPHVIGPVDPDNPSSDEQPIIAPVNCPSCNGPLRRDNDILKCDNTLNCAAQGQRRLIHWGGRSAADIESLGEKWLIKFADSGLVNTPADIYSIQYSDLFDAQNNPRYEGMGKKLAEKMLNSIEESKEVGLRKALIGFSIPYASEGTAKRLCRNGYNSIEDVMAASKEDLMKVEDIGEHVAEQITTFFSRPEIQQEVAKMRAAGVNLDVLDEDKPVKKNGRALPLDGKSVVITGTLEGISRKEMQAKVEAAGGKASSSVSKNTDYLICGEKAGSKKAKAEQLGVNILTQADAEALLA